MTCTRPWLYKNDEGVILELPCRRCIACRISKSREWAVRCENELDYHKEASFLTLTYSDEFLPPDLSLNKKDVQLFNKRLRFSIQPKRIKVLYSGEYGDDFGRPHYHLIVFGWRPEFDDLYFIGQKGKRKYYSSKVLNDLWPFGNNYVGVVEPKSIQYVTRYCIKKLYGDPAKESYGSRVHPFMHASKGLGLQYALDNAERIEEEGVVIRGRKCGTPSYYYKKMDLDPQVAKERAVKKIRDRNKSHYSDKDLHEIHKIELSHRRHKEKILQWKEQNL